jgi:hypothetical protein
MKNEALCGLRLLLLCSWGVILMIAASSAGCTSGLGTGYDQNSQGAGPVFPQNPVPPFGVTPQGQGQTFGNPMPQNNTAALGGAMAFGQQPAPQVNVPNVIENNAMLPNQTQATYNTATQDMKVPFQVDTSRMLAFSAVVDNNVQTVTVIDPINQALMVYNIYLSGPEAGRCELMSGRNISADFMFDEYQAMRPLPKELRALLEQKEKNNR